MLIEISERPLIVQCRMLLAALSIGCQQAHESSPPPHAAGSAAVQASTATRRAAVTAGGV